jgi:hypothetical protein
MAAKTVKDTKVYQLAFALSMHIFPITKHSPKKKATHLLTGSGVLQEVSVFVYVKRIERKDILPILLLKCRILIWKIQRQKVGLNFHWLVNISPRKSISSYVI